MRIDIRVSTVDDYPSIVDIHKSLNIVWPEKPGTPEAWAEADRRRDPKCKYQRWVATRDKDVVGYGYYTQSIWDYHPQRFYINVEVHPDHRCEGIGAALYDRIMEGLLPLEPRVLRADAFTNLPQGFTFLQKRGFFEAFRETPVHLDVSSFDLSPYAGLETRLRAQGVVIKTLREMASDPGRDLKIYDLFWEVDEDLPREGPVGEKPPFEEWLSWGLNDPALLPDAYFIAMRGDDYIGLRELWKYRDDNVLLGSLLGVRRRERGQGIALAMQLRSIAYAKEHGYRQLKTCTAIQNAPMQALFKKLGFARDPEWMQCQRDIER